MAFFSCNLWWSETHVVTYLCSGGMGRLCEGTSSSFCWCVSKVTMSRAAQWQPAAGPGLRSESDLALSGSSVIETGVEAVCQKRASIQCQHMEASRKSTPHSVKRWQLGGTDYERRSETRFSTWTPLNNKSSNLQVRGTSDNRKLMG